MAACLGCEERARPAQVEKENEQLKRVVRQRGGVLGPTESADPYVLNKFLRHVLDLEWVEECPQREMAAVFPEGFCFPPLESLSAAQLRQKLEDIYAVLWAHNIFVDLAADLPDALAYTYIVQEILPQQIPVEFPQGLHLHFLGCQGHCPTCFQRGFCEIEED